MKKQLLFVIDSLHCAGAEKSLVTLLELIDYDQYEVDLQLFGFGGALEQYIPKMVNLLPPFSYTDFLNLDLSHAIKEGITKRKLDMLQARLKYSAKIRRKYYSNPQKARLFWQQARKVIPSSNKQYDIAISYAQGVPTFYVAEKVTAKKKFAWVNVSYRLEEEDKAFQRPYYAEYNKIVAVSTMTRDIFAETFPEYKNRMTVVYDMVNPKLIERLSLAKGSCEDNYKGLKLLTIGRLAAQKGYDIAILACKKLKESGVDFRWYILGKGPLEVEIRKRIKEEGLEDYFILLGVRTNPYPYIREADIYVQTSKYEGFGLAITEARILNKPVVTTEFDAVYHQMVQGENGLVVPINGEAVYEGIMRLIKEPELYKHIVSYLKEEKKGNLEEIEVFYKLIGGI